jgi:hypothetical protein
VIFTSIERHVEYWLADNVLGIGSPVHDAVRRTEAAPRGSVATGVSTSAIARSPAMEGASPRQIHHR